MKRPGIVKLLCLYFMLVLITNNQAHSAQPPRNFAQARREFKAFFEQSMRGHGIVGGGMMLIGENQIIAQEFYGLANREKGQPVTESTIYHWASITKTLTGIAIMQLRDRGLVSLDDPITRYLPELQMVHNPSGQTSDIRLRHLMSHSAGFRESTWPWGGEKSWHPFEPREWSQIVAMLPYTEVAFKPGSRFSYSNPAVIFLGRVIEIVTGDDYEVYIDKNIFKPLEMYRSYFDTTPIHLLKDRAAGYYIRDGVISAAPFDPDTGITVSNGGLNAPLPDMVRYVNFLLGDPRRQAGYDQILKRTSLMEMITPQLPIESGGLPEQTGVNRRDSIGLSFLLEENHGMKFFGHYGEQAGFVSHLYVRPESRTAYLVAFNTNVIATEKSSAQSTMRLDRELKDYLFSRIFSLFGPK